MQKMNVRTRSSICNFWLYIVVYMHIMYIAAFCSSNCVQMTWIPFGAFRKRTSRCCVPLSSCSIMHSVLKKLYWIASMQVLVWPPFTLISFSLIHAVPRFFFPPGATSIHCQLDAHKYAFSVHDNGLIWIDLCQGCAGHFLHALCI